MCWIDEKLQQADYNKLDKIREEVMGRKKLTNERFQVRCHPKVIKDVRKYAKERSEEYLSESEKIINSKNQTQCKE